MARTVDVERMRRYLYRDQARLPRWRVFGDEELAQFGDSLLRVWLDRIGTAVRVVSGPSRVTATATRDLASGAVTVRVESADRVVPDPLTSTEATTDIRALGQ